MAPTDLVKVRAAVRLGWLMAEVKGRARQDSPAWDDHSPMARGNWALPLASERSPVEIGIERANALAAVARQAGVDLTPSAKVVTDLSQLDELPDDLRGVVGAAKQTYGPIMCALVTGVLVHRPVPGADASKPYASMSSALGEVLFYWDAAVQDHLLGVSDQVANGYELGRALAETYWALDPAAERLVDEAGTELPNPVCWQFLFGRERRMTISRLLQRLAPYLGLRDQPGTGSQPRDRSSLPSNASDEE